MVEESVIVHTWFYTMKTLNVFDNIVFIVKKVWCKEMKNCNKKKEKKINLYVCKIVSGL